MELHLVRHAPAEERGGRRKDEARPLTADGRRRFARALKGLGAVGVRFDKLCHSPWLRASEAADLLAPLLDPGGETAVLGGLAAAPTPALVPALAGARVAAVGHAPWLSELAALLLFGDAKLAAKLPLKKGAVLHLRGEPRPGGMELVAALPPKALRALRR